MTFLNWLWSIISSVGILWHFESMSFSFKEFCDILRFAIIFLARPFDVWGRKGKKKEERKTLLAPNLPDKQLASIGSISHWSQWALAATQINLVLNWCTTAFKLLVPDRVFQLSPAVSCHPRPMERRLVLRQHSVLQPFLPAMLASCWWGQLSESACHLGFGVELKHDV